jgi:hypothetical protein
MQLLPCPFCGTVPEEFGRGPDGAIFANCPDCLASIGALTPAYRTEQEAGEAWNTRALPSRVETGIPGVLVIEATRHLSSEERAWITSTAEKALPPGHRCLVLDAGLRVAPMTDARLVRIEERLDALLDAIASEGQEEAEESEDRTASLDGSETGRAAIRPLHL